MVLILLLVHVLNVRTPSKPLQAFPPSGAITPCCMVLCGSALSAESVDQPGEVANNPARGQLNRENVLFRGPGRVTIR